VDPPDGHPTRICLGSSALEKDLTQILAGDPVPPLGEWDGMPSMAAGEVKDVAAVRQIEEFDDALHLTRGALPRKYWTIDVEILFTEEAHIPGG
jgi:hypothetical protein